MQAFSRGWSFLQQAWHMVLKDRDLIKPSIYALIVGMIVSVIGIIPIIGAALLFGDSQFGNIVLFVLGAILVFSQFIISYVFSAMTVYLIFGYLAEGDGRMDKAWTIIRRDLLDLVTLEPSQRPSVSSVGSRTGGAPAAASRGARPGPPRA